MKVSFYMDLFWDNAKLTSCGVEMTHFVKVISPNSLPIATIWNGDEIKQM